ELARLNELIATGRSNHERAELASEDAVAEDQLRHAAAASGVILPLDYLAREVSLDPFEIEAITLCAAIELDPAYGALFAFLHDDAGRRRPSIELVSSLTTPLLAERVARRFTLGRLGRVRRYGLLRAIESKPEAETELAVSAEALRFITGMAHPCF